MNKLYDPTTIKSIVDRVAEQFRDKDLYTSLSSMPAWLVSLPVGIYTAKELVLISKTGKRNVAKIMKKYCTKIEYVQSVKPHLQKCLYHWGLGK